MRVINVRIIIIVGHLPNVNAKFHKVV